MSTIAEIQKVISQMPEGEWQKIKDWLNTRPDSREFTDDGLHIKDTKAKIAQAEKGTFRKVNPEEQIKKLAASLE